MKADNRYIKLLEQLNDIIFELDIRGNICDIRGKGLSDFGYNSDGIINRNFSIFFNSHDSYENLILKQLDRKKDIFLSDIYLYTRGKQDIPCSLTLSYIHETGTFMGTVRNINEKIRLEKEREELRSLLIKNEKLSFIGSLVQGFAHNLTSPLSGILAGCEILNKRYGSQKEIELIKSLTNRINDVVSNLLDKSRKENTISQQWCSINTMIEEILKFLEADLSFKHKYARNLELGGDLPDIYGIYGDFSQSLQNIIVNAIDAMKATEKKILQIRTFMQGQNLIVQIKDTGHGIKEEHKLRIFEPFFTTKLKEDSKAQSGTGLGLTITKKLLSSYDVDISLKSEEGKGTAFILTFPPKILRYG